MAVAHLSRKRVCAPGFLEACAALAKRAVEAKVRHVGAATAREELGLFFELVNAGLPEESS